MAEPKNDKAVLVSSSEVGGPVEDLRNRLNSWDLNLPLDYDPDKKYRNSWAGDEKGLGTEEENSPYEEVRAAVPNYDEDMPANTIRAWTLGLLLSAFGASINTLFSLRQPAISVGTIVAQLVAFAVGKGWERVLPNRQFNTFGLKWCALPFLEYAVMSRTDLVPGISIPALSMSKSIVSL